MIRLDSNKGYLLAIIMIFAAVLMTAMLGLQSYVRSSAKEVLRDETGYVKGYYAAMAGLRYASILLRDPEAITFGAAHAYTVTGTELGGDFMADVIGQDLATLTVTITEITSGQFEGQYSVSATYNRQ